MLMSLTIVLPGLHALTVENGDEQPFDHPDLEDENTK
jgi:hypothetical protein